MSKKDSSFDFNCLSECGEYEDEDTEGEALRKECSMIYKKGDCQQNFVSKKPEACDEWCDISNTCKPPIIKGWKGSTYQNYGTHAGNIDNFKPRN